MYSYIHTVYRVTEIIVFFNLPTEQCSNDPNNDIENHGKDKQRSQEERVTVARLGKVLN